MNAPVTGTRTPIFDLLRTREPAPAEAPGDLIDFTRLGGTLWRGRLWILVAAVVAAVLGGLWAALVAVPQYRATAVLIMAPENLAPSSLAGVVPGLSSDSVAVNTEVEILQSRTLLQTLARELGLTDDPEFNNALRAPSLFERWRPEFLSRSEAGQAAAGADPVLSRTVDALQDRLAVRSIPDSRIFEVTAESLDPAKAAAIANALARLYLGAQVALKQDEASRATDWLTDRVAELQLELEQTDSRARRFAAEMDLVTPEALEALALQLNEIRRRIAARQADLRRNGAPASRIRAQIEPMQAMQADLAERVRRHSQGLVELGQLQLEAEASRLVYEHFLGRLKETAVQRGIQKADSRILSPAEVPVLPSWPDPLVIAPLSGFLAAVLVIALLLTREARSRVFRSIRQLETETRRPVHGALPALPGKSAAAAARRLATRPASYAAECVRGLRTTLFVSPDVTPQVLLVTSSQTGEGTAALAGALGQSLAGLNRRVLVVEADIPRRGARRLRRQRGAPGLLAVLEGRCPLAKAVHRPKGAGFELLASEAARATAADLLSSRQIETLIKTARQQYDAILIVSPPVLAVPDARLLGRLADAVLYAVAWDRTSAGQVMSGLRTLQAAALPVSGLVLTQVDPRGMARYGNDGGIRAFRASGYFEA